MNIIIKSMAYTCFSWQSVHIFACRVQADIVKTIIHTPDRIYGNPIVQLLLLYNL